ncbi:MAG TPA: monovalent cation:proton antiporter-2 (CPA2) family protein [Burkholderiales bacterium]|nr:monovalent cation:proton antiporter-2 (CPA2) family protein [Burkholderiales bacterium]
MNDHGFLEQALVYLAAGVIAVPVFKRLGLGSVLGYLVAGVAIGPWGLRLIAEPGTVLQFAEFGVVLLLFLVGLELNPARLWALRRPIFGLGSVQVLATVAAVTALGIALGQPLVVSLVAGMGFAMSSTAIGLATLAEKNLLPTPGGQASFSVLLFQDLAVIPLVLLLALMSGGGNGAATFDWLSAAKAVALIGLLVVAGRYFLRPLLRFVANTELREVFVGFSLLLVLGIAALMQAVGLSMALGAFLAGVLLADSEYRHELELDIEPFKGLLLGLFFIAVGMSVDLRLFLDEPLLVLGLAGGVVALKVVLLYAVARPFYCGRSDARLFALALSQIGEFAFVLFGAAGQILPRATIDLLNAVVAASMLSTPLLMFVYVRLVAPLLAHPGTRAADIISEANPVIVAGFGRFGQIVSRVLGGAGIATTVIDHDPNQVDLVRRFGTKAYYGDATRLDLLRAAGADKAALMVVAVDDVEAALAITRLARQNFPRLRLLVRAHGRTDAFEYVEMGVPAVRETLGSALDAAQVALRELGFHPHSAWRIAAQFRRRDEAMLAEHAPHRHDEKKLIAVSQQARADLNALLREEAARLRGTEEPGWR